MKLPRDISGAKLIAALCRHWDYVKVNQDGSHVILQTEEPTHQRIAVPAHSRLRIGTFSAILRAVANHKGVRREDVLKSL